METDFLSLDGRSFIDGRWTPGDGETWLRCSPVDGTVTWQGRWSSAEQVTEAVAAARAAFPNWAETSLEARMQICRSFASIAKDKQEELSRLIARETGKPLWEARTEATAVIGKVANSIDAILKRRWTTTEELGELRAVTRYRPHGVMLVLGPFNLPAHLPGGHIVPGLLAGNTIVFKPSEWTPATGQWLVEQWIAAGLPAGILNLVHGAAEVAKAAVANEQVDGVLFTGSSRVGTQLHRALAGQPQRILALEMGGNNPLIVHRTSDIGAAAITTILSAYITSGQRCTCARRLLVVGKDQYEQLVEQLVHRIPKICVDLPFAEPQPFMGTLIHAKAAEDILTAQQSLVDSGGSVIAACEQRGESAALVSPGLIAIKEQSQLDDCEHFGPLLTVQRADDFDEAIALANQTQFGLAAGFIGDDVKDFYHMLHRIRAGVVNWNRQTTGASGKLPFGGVGASGNHNPSGFFAADYCSYPMASLESHELTEAKQPIPGLEPE